MSSRRDEDAFTWEGDDDPTLQVDAVDEAADGQVKAETTADAAPAPLPEGFTAVGKGSETIPGPDEGDAPAVAAEPAALGNAALVGIGVLGGVYLLFAIGWIIGGLRLQGTAQFLVSPVVYQVALWLAVLAAPLWFATTYLLTRDSKTWVRIVWLVVGALLLVPWPFIMTGAVGR